MAAAKRDYSGDNKRQKFEYQCSACTNWYPQKEVSVDHIIPVGALQSFDDLPGFTARLFVGVEKLQVLCSVCHLAKTAEEREERIHAHAQRDETEVDGRSA
jgi:hypothetical protein